MIDNNIDQLATTLTAVLGRYNTDEFLSDPSAPGVFQPVYRALKVIALLLDG
jgi:hypothetical protein